MIKLYLLGGENVGKRDAKEINALAFQEAGGSPAVLVFPWARPSSDASYSRRKRLVTYFRSLGACSVEFSEFSDPFDDIATRVRKSDLIYLTGGQTSALLSRLQRSGVDKLLKDYPRLIVGRSAGAMALGKNCLVTNRYSGNRKVILGLGLTDFSINVHYDSSKDNLLRRLSKKEKIYAIPRGAAVVSRGVELSFFGEVFLFKDGQKTLAR